LEQPKRICIDSQKKLRQDISFTRPANTGDGVSKDLTDLRPGYFEVCYGVHPPESASIMATVYPGSVGFS
jgi:hypothetical protein